MEARDPRPLLLFVAPYFPPAYYGGAVQIYLGLLNRLQQFRIIVVADKSGSVAAEREAWDREAALRRRFAVHRISAFELHLDAEAAQGSQTPASAIVSRLRCGAAFFRNGKREWRKLVSTYRPDLILCGGTYSAGWLMQHFDAAMPLVNYLHGEELTMQVSPRLLMPYMRRRQMQSIRRAELNVAVSSYTARLAEMLAGADPAKMTVLPNFVDAMRFCVSGRRAALRMELGWSDRLVILTLARLEPRKGIDQALRALALLEQRTLLPDNWSYVIAGQGRERERLERLSRDLGLSARIVFRGFVPEKEVAALYEAADIFLQPNRNIRGDTEGFGVVFLEASACGLPVIGGTAGGTADAIAEGVSGLRVDAESVESIAAAVRLLSCDRELRRKLGTQGAARVASQFTVDQAAARFGDLLAGVLAQHRALWVRQ